VVLFREKEVDEAATFAKPIQPARGIETVLVNGEVVWRGGQPTGARPGMVLSRAGGKPGARLGNSWYISARRISSQRMHTSYRRHKRLLVAVNSLLIIVPAAQLGQPRASSKFSGSE